MTKKFKSNSYELFMNEKSTILQEEFSKYLSRKNRFWDDVNWDDRWNETMMDVLEVVTLGSRKHGAGSWADPTNPSIEHKACIASLHRHLAALSVDPHAIDPDTGRTHAANIICRTLMKQTSMRINNL